MASPDSKPTPAPAAPVPPPKRRGLGAITQTVSQQLAAPAQEVAYAAIPPQPVVPTPPAATPPAPPAPPVASPAPATEQATEDAPRALSVVEQVVADDPDLAPASKPDKKPERAAKAPEPRTYAKPTSSGRKSAAAKTTAALDPAALRQTTYTISTEAFSWLHETSDARGDGQAVVLIEALMRADAHGWSDVLSAAARQPGAGPAESAPAPVGEGSGFGLFVPHTATTSSSRKTEKLRIRLAGANHDALASLAKRLGIKHVSRLVDAALLWSARNA